MCRKISKNRKKQSKDGAESYGNYFVSKIIKEISFRNWVSEYLNKFCPKGEDKQGG